VDWSHLERERAAIAANKARREGAGQDPDARGDAGPLIGANEVPQRARRDPRDDRDNRSARDQRGSRSADRVAHDDDQYGDQYEAHARRDERDRRRDGWDERDARGRLAHADRGGRAPDRRYDDDDDRAADGDDDSYDGDYDDGDYPGGDERRPRLKETDESAAWATPARQRDQRWDGARAAIPAREDAWQPGGGAWGDLPDLGDVGDMDDFGDFGDTGASASFGAPPLPATQGSARPAKGGKAGKAGKGAKPRKKGVFTRAWLIRSAVLSVAVFILLRVFLRLELQHALSFLAPPASPTATSAQVFTDGLLTNHNGWLTNADCVFKADGYHLTRGYLAYAPVADTTNFDTSVQVTQKAGTVLAPYGLVFRRVSLGNYYVFGIDGNGKWTFYKALQNVGTDIVSFTASPAIKQGLNAQNTLEVKAQGAHFTFYVNGTQVGQADDSSLAGKGALGVAGHDDIEVIFTAFSLKRLP
jgi:hypothetical protein